MGYYIILMEETLCSGGKEILLYLLLSFMVYFLEGSAARAIVYLNAWDFWFLSAIFDLF